MRNSAEKSLHSILIVENKDSLIIVDNCDTKSTVENILLSEIEIKLVLYLFQNAFFRCTIIESFLGINLMIIHCSAQKNS